MNISWINISALVACITAGMIIATHNAPGTFTQQISNISYDPTRELYHRLNPVFTAQYKKATGETVDIRQSHGGSSYQARQVATGEQSADVVTLGLPSDIDAIEKRGLIGKDWRTRLPNDAQPYHSTIVFVVRKGNPLSVYDWPDLVRPKIEIIVPDPKTSGNGKLAALAAWGFVMTHGGGENEARNFLKSLYDHAPFLVPAARAAGVAFAVEKKGDVQLAWENEALREVEASKGTLEIVYPSMSILAEPSVAWVDTNIEKHQTAQLARAYLQFLFTEEAQEIIAAEGYRPTNRQVLSKYATRFPEINLFPITLIAASWSDAHQKFFAENGIIDAIYVPKPRTD